MFVVILLCSQFALTAAATILWPTAGAVSSTLPLAFPHSTPQATFQATFQATLHATFQQLRREDRHYRVGNKPLFYVGFAGLVAHPPACWQWHKGSTTVACPAGTTVRSCSALSVVFFYYSILFSFLFFSFIILFYFVFVFALI